MSQKATFFVFGGFFEFLQLVISKQPYGLGPLFFKTKKDDFKKWSLDGNSAIVTFLRPGEFP